jgi:gamma-glutamyltranspeptidase / glutathione hydrolase
MSRGSAAAPPPHAPGRPSFLASTHMISTTQYLATVAGYRILESGGNAIDAGVAAGLAINVVDRQFTDLGGVAPIMIHRAGAPEPETIDGLGRWPVSLSLAELLKRFGGELPMGVHRSVTPAALDAWLTALAGHGTMTLGEVAAPAIELTEGFPVPPSLAAHIVEWRDLIAGWPTTARVFLPDGRPLQVGELLVQPELGSLFRHLVAVEARATASCREGRIMAARDDLYRGSVAEEIAAFFRSEGAALSLEDLASAAVTVSPAVHTAYRGVDVYATGPWSQGPVVPMVLNMLEGFDVAAHHGTALHYHRVTEAVKLACADREGYFGDPDMVDVPIDGLLSKEYASERRSLIDDERAAPALPLPGNPWRHEGRCGPAGYVPSPRSGPSAPDTAYVCVVDRHGNAFSATPSDPALLGPVVPGVGITVSTRGSQLWLDPAHPSAIAPRKRPRLTPNPGMLVVDGHPLMPFGCPGADAQSQAMVQVITNLLDRGMDVQTAIEHPRVISMSFPDSVYPHAYAPGRLLVEGHLTRGLRDTLERLGHQVDDLPRFSPTAAGVCGIVLGQGVLVGGADPRRESLALGR